MPTLIDTSEQLQQAAENLTSVYQMTIQERIPINRPCPHSKRWWNSDLRSLKKRVNQLSKLCLRQRAVPDHPCHEEQKQVVNEYGEAILKAKYEHWTNFLEEADDHDLWMAIGYLKEPTGDGGKTQIPTLKTMRRSQL